MNFISQASFLNLFNLCPVTPRSDSHTILENQLTAYPSYCSDLSNKNNKIVTGYENFVVKKGTLRLFPDKDFEFVGKHVVCLKCCQKFASRISYRAHVGTSICNRNGFEPNIVYQNYKNRNSRRIRKKNKKIIDDLPHDIKKNLLNPEMLNTLQTRNNCYSDIVYKRNKVKEKSKNGVYNSENSTAKKPRGRPKKNIEIPKKRGRPKKLNIPSTSGNNSVNHVESYETNSKESNSPSICSADDASGNSSVNHVESYETNSKESNSPSNCSADDAFNNNIHQINCDHNFSLVEHIMVNETCRLLSYKLNNTRKNQNLDKHNDELQRDKEDKLSKHNEHYLGLLKNQLISYNNTFKNGPDVGSKFVPEDLDMLISSFDENINECRQSKPKKTDVNSELTADKGKENIHCINETDSEADCTENETYPDHELQNVEDIVGQCIKQKESVLSSIESIEKKSSEDELRGDDRKSHDTPYSIDNHSSDDGNKCQLTCKICNLNFLCVAEWKTHNSEHKKKKTKKNKKYWCKICGRFKIHNHCTQHLRERKVPKINGNKKFVKKFRCESCGREYDYLKSYYTHVKTHIK